MVSEVVHTPPREAHGVLGVGRRALVRGEDGAQGEHRGGRPREGLRRGPLRVPHQGGLLVSSFSGGHLACSCCLRSSSDLIVFGGEAALVSSACRS